MPRLHDRAKRVLSLLTPGALLAGCFLDWDEERASGSGGRLEGEAQHESGLPDGASDDEPPPREAGPSPLLTDAGDETGEAPADATPASCTCENGGACSDAGCACRDGFTGPDCELLICPDVVIRSEADLRDAARCAEIRGRLRIATAGVEAITEEDFPYLTKISDDLDIDTFFDVTDTPPLRTLVLAKLVELGGRLRAASGVLTEVSFPALTTLGTEAFPGGISFSNTETHDLRFPMLATVHGGIYLRQLPKLCRLYVRPDTVVTGVVEATEVPNLGLSQVPKALGEVSVYHVGCCVYGDTSLTCDLNPPPDERKFLCSC